MGLLETPRRGRPRKDSVMDTLAVRLPDDLVGQVDQYMEQLRADLPGLNISRADAIRQLLAAGLKAEKERMS